MPQAPPSGGSLIHWLLSEGSRLPSLMPSPPCHLTVYFPLKSLHELAIADEMFQAATMIAALLLHLGILYSPCQAHHKLFHNSFNSARIIALFFFIATGVLFLQMHQMHSWHFQDGLVALEFPQGEETGSPWFWRIIGCLSPWAPGQLHGIFFLSFSGWPLGSQNKSLPVGPPSGRPPLLLVAWGAHHKSSPSLTLPLNQGESSQGRKQLEPGDVLKDRHPSLIQFLCPPSIVGIAPDLVHPTLSHYYSVHLRLSTHHPKLYPYWSSALTHQGSLAKTK